MSKFYLTAVWNYGTLKIEAQQGIIMTKIRSGHGCLKDYDTGGYEEFFNEATDNDYVDREVENMSKLTEDLENKEKKRTRMVQDVKSQDGQE